MSEDKRPALIDPKEPGTLAGWISELARQARLAWRLFWDKRVSFWVKLIPIAAIAWVTPIIPPDIIPDAIPGLGQLDDIAILLLGFKLFVELSPPEIVREHLIALGARIKEWRVVEEEKAGPPVVVEGEYDLIDTKAEEGKEAEAVEAEEA
jgi:uncharacterized membrane protein YkvA (DUF1232 family)